MQDDHDQPFEIPSTYQIEPELRAPLPRAVPDTLRRHPLRVARQASNRKALGITLALAVVSFFLRDTRFFETLGMYFTPLAHLEWVSPIVAVLCLVALVDWHPWKKDPFRYLREGIPLVGQIVDLRLEVATRVNGQDTNMVYDAYFMTLHPMSGKETVFCLRSPQFGVDQAMLNCRVGDWVTAVYLPGDLDSLTLYGFTDVNPERSLVQLRPAASAGMALLAILGTIFLCGWILSTHALERVGQSFLLATCLPGTVLGAALTYRLVRAQRQRHQLEQERAMAEGLPLAGSTHRQGSLVGSMILGAFVGCLAMGVLLVGVNGLFDRSQAVVQPVRVVNTWVTTHQAIFNTYEIEYADPNTGKNEKMGVSPLDLNQPGDLTAELLTYKGALGWPRQRMRVRPLTEAELTELGPSESAPSVDGQGGPGQQGVMLEDAVNKAKAEADRMEAQADKAISEAEKAAK